MASPWGAISIFKAYPELILAISCFLFFYIISKITTNRGCGLPIRWPIVGHIPYAILHHDRLHDWSTDVLRNSGCSFVFNGPVGSLYDILLTCDPANVNHVFNANFANYPKGEDFAEIFDFLGDGIFNSDKEPWRFQRKKAHSLMAVPKFRSFVVEASKAKVDKSLIPLLSHFVEHPDKSTLDLQDVFTRFSFDMTCIVVFGIDPGCLAIDLPTVPFAKAMDEAEEVVFFRHLIPKTWWKAMRWMRIGPEKKYAEAVEVLDRVIDEYISKRREVSTGSACDLLSSYLDSEAEIGESGFKEFHKFLRDTTLNLMVAGRDTISSALTWFFYLVAKNPNVEAKILQELRDHGNGADLGELVYLHAALCESLRLYPPVPFEHKAAVKPDTLPSGVEVNDRRRVIFSSYAMGRMEGVWGKDCMEFRPERWISETGRVRHEPSYKFFAFNAGPRTCVGKDMAFTQLKAVAAAVIGRFRVRVVEGFVARPKLSIILHMKDGLMVKVSKREDHHSLSSLN